LTHNGKRRRALPKFHFRATIIAVDISLDATGERRVLSATKGVVIGTNTAAVTVLALPPTLCAALARMQMLLLVSKARGPRTPMITVLHVWMKRRLTR
jgi:hypothetical protein